MKIDLKEMNIPKPPVIKTTADLKREKEEEKLKGLVAFDLSKDYDMEKMSDRFLKQFNSINPRNYLYTNAQIKAMQKVMDKYNARKEVADNMGQ